MKRVRRLVTAMRGGGALAPLVCALALVLAAPLHAYLKIGTDSGGQTVALSWKQSPVRYFVTDAGVDGVTAADFRDAVGRAFHAWQDVTSARVRVEFASFTEAPPLDEDNTNTLGFLAHPDMERTLAATNYVIDTRSGEILEADIFFNSSFPWSVSPGGEQGRYDLQSIATHETGHFFGLGHSALGETEVEPGGGRRLIAAGSVMFPIAFSAGDTTSPDAETRRHRRDLGHLPCVRLPLGDRIDPGHRDEERPGPVRRARDRHEPADRRHGGRLLAAIGRRVRDRGPCSRHLRRPRRAARRW